MKKEPLVLILLFSMTSLFAGAADEDQAKMERVILNYMEARDGNWTLSRTLESGALTTTRAFPNPQKVEGPWSFYVLNTEDTWRSYKKYRESYTGGVITAEFFDSADSKIPNSTVSYMVDTAVGPDAHGWYHLTLTGQMNVGGVVNDIQRRLKWNGDILISEFALRPDGSDGPYRAWFTNTIARTE